VVKLTRIYTKTGDDGTTSLGDMSRTSKNDPRLEAYATVDEANSQLGLVIALGTPEADVEALLLRIQNDLFDVGADLCVPVIDKPSVEPLRVTLEQVEALETAIDIYNAELSSLRSFILPGGDPTAALMHVARTVIRRAERETWAAIHAFGQGVNPLTARYLNRLSDLLFVLARYANRHEGDQLWVPGANR
jgi:cob(I)alamin adenosyltransferase